jgi:hypothetical protein
VTAPARPVAPAPPLAAVERPPALDGAWPSDGLGPVVPVFDALPPPDRFEPGSWVGLLAEPEPPTWWARWLKPRRFVHRAVRCAALLARGYEEVGAGVDAEGRDLAWGRVPSRAGASAVDGDGHDPAAGRTATGGVTAPPGATSAA